MELTERIGSRRGKESLGVELDIVGALNRIHFSLEEAKREMEKSAPEGASRRRLSRCICPGGGLDSQKQETVSRRTRVSGWKSRRKLHLLLQTHADFLRTLSTPPADLSRPSAPTEPLGIAEQLPGTSTQRLELPERVRTVWSSPGCFFQGDDAGSPTPL